jgi:RNA polymerase-interacting CarD/CdnL/TRCF family regulator
MEFQVGDKVIHWTYGLGEIVELDEKVLAGQTTSYYVVRIADMSIWVPIDQVNGDSLRLPTPAHDFQRLFTILGSPGEPLSEDRLERKTQLQKKMRDGTLESICEVIRDLSFANNIKKLNENDAATLNRAKSLLLSEWGISLSVPMNQAEDALNSLLGRDSSTKPKK